MGKKDIESIPLNEYVGFAFKRWYYFVLSLGLCLGIAYLIAKSLQPVYLVSSTIHLDSGEGGAKNEVLMKEMEIFEAGTSISDQINIISSNRLMNKVLDKMDMNLSYFKKGDFTTSIDKDICPFSIVLDNSHAQPIYFEIHVQQTEDGSFTISFDEGNAYLYILDDDKIIGEAEIAEYENTVKADTWVETQYFKFKILPNENWSSPTGDDYFFTLNSRFNLLKELQNKIQISPIDDKSNIVQLVSKGKLIEQEKEFLNAVMYTYIEDRNERKLAHAYESLKFIDDAIESANSNLVDAESSLESFRQQSKIIDVGTTSGLLKEQQIKLEEKQTNLALRIQNYNIIKNVLKNQKAQDDIVLPTAQQLEDWFLRDLFIKLADIKRQKALDEISAISGSKPLKQFDVQISSTINAISDHVNNTLSSLNIEQRSIRSRLSKVNSELARIPVNEKRLNKINRNSEFADENYKYLIKRRAEASLALSSEDANTFVVDEAELESNKPVSPNKMLIYAFGCILGLCLPIVGKISYDLMNNKIMSIRDLELMTNIPIIGMVVKSDLVNRVVSPETYQTRLAESFRSARVQLNHLIASNNLKSPKVIGFTSTSPNEGKSFSAANFASTLAISGKRTVLIDLDMRKPDQRNYFSYDNSIGLHGYLTDPQRDIVDIVTQIRNIGNLWVFPSGPVCHNSLDLLESRRFLELIEILKDEFDYVIFDTPPVGQTSDYYIIKDLVDITVYIVRHNLTTLSTLERINQLYSNGSLGNMAVLINGVKDVEDYNYGQATSYAYGKNTYGYKEQATPQKKFKDIILEKIRR